MAREERTQQSKSARETAASRSRATKRRLQSAVDKAADYRAERDKLVEHETDADAVRPMEEWRDIVSQRIEDAMRQGLFDNLPGAGKPLDLRRDPFIPDDQQMAVTLLRNNGLSPQWISERKAILSAVDDLRTELRLAATSMREALHAVQGPDRVEGIRAEWTVWLGRWQQRMDRLNDRILVHNLKQPVRHLEITMLLMADEQNRAGAKLEWSEEQP